MKVIFSRRRLRGKDWLHARRAANIEAFTAQLQRAGLGGGDVEQGFEQVEKAIGLVDTIGERARAPRPGRLRPAVRARRCRGAG